MPIDPHICEALFNALRHNFTLQELILSQSCLNHCKSFDAFFDAVQNNRYSALTMVDFSDNFHTIDENEQWHEDFLNALLNQ
jgi:hypothetical protein